MVEVVGVKESAIAVIGPITARTATDLGLTVSVMPKSYTFPSLRDAIVDYYPMKA